MVRPGATVIDVGTNRTDDGLVGDVDFDAAKEVAGAITPVPGGVGPMTIAMLLSNTAQAARARLKPAAASGLNPGLNPYTEADLDSQRLRTGEIVAGIGGIALIIFLFFDWFGGAPEVSGSVINGTATISSTGISGWDSLTDLPGFLIILSGVAGIALLFLGASGQRVNIPVARGGVTAGLGVLGVLLIVWRMLVGSPDLKIGIFLGLAAVVAVAAGALMALREDGIEPLVSVGPRGRTSSSATAPTASAPTRSAPKRSTASRSKSSSSSKKSSSSRSGSKASSSKRSSGSRSGSRSRKS